MQFTAVQCSAVQCSAVQCNAMQCSVVQYSAVQSLDTVSLGCHILRGRVWAGDGQWCVVLYSAVRYSAVQCSMMQCSAVQCCTTVLYLAGRRMGVIDPYIWGSGCHGHYSTLPTPRYWQRNVLELLVPSYMASLKSLFCLEI